MEIHKKMYAKKLKAATKIIKDKNPRFYVSIITRYATELQLGDTAVVELKEVMDVARFIKAGELMTDDERHEAGIDRLLTTNEHLPQPCAYNPVRTLDGLKELFDAGHVRKPDSPRCASWEECMFDELKAQGLVIQLTIDDFHTVADEV